VRFPNGNGELSCTLESSAARNSCFTFILLLQVQDAFSVVLI
jgi:hypothetical protein